MLVLLFLTVPVFGQHTELSSEVIASIEQRIADGINPSIVVGLIDNDGPRYYAYGKTAEGGKDANEHTIYEIGSISKTFTGVLLAHNVLTSTMKLEDPIEQYLPSKVKVPSRNAEKITLGHLSDHTSSLPRLPSNMDPRDNSNPYADYTVKQMYDFLSDYSLPRDIGSEYEYSNFAQGLLGHILAEHAGISFEELMIKLIAEPLGMDETKINFDERMRRNLAIGHANGQEVSNWDLPTLAGAGAIRSSMHDMLLYLNANLSKEHSPLHKAMHLSHQVRHDKAGGASVGLGWHIRETSDGAIAVMHSGGTGGYRTFCGFIKEKGIGVAVFTNSGDDANDIGIHLLDPERALREVKPHIARELRKTIDADGVDAAIMRFNEIKESQADKYDFSEGPINSLGYYYMSFENYKAAKAIFRLNISEYPESSNVYDSFGEALMENGEILGAIENYKKSLELNPGNTNAVEMLAKMGVQYEADEFIVSPEILASYAGAYQLMEGFKIVVTVEDDKIFGQATGQPQFEMFPKSDTEFYLKVVDARIVFNFGKENQVQSLTLFQGGQEIEGKKVPEAN